MLIRFGEEVDADVEDAQDLAVLWGGEIRTGQRTNAIPVAR